MSARLQSKLHRTINQVIQDKISPSIVFCAQVNEEVLCNVALGTSVYQGKEIFPVAQNTIYDIASITKIIVATLALILVDENRLALHDMINQYIPVNYPSKITVQHLLTHTSGIDVQMSKLAALENPKEIETALYNATLATKPGSQVIFTNVNSFLLGKIIETITNQSLDEVLSTKLLRPLHMENTFFNPPERLKKDIPPTEITTDRGLIQGEVHDESAYALGGIAGHAGLFSTVTDLCKFGLFWLREGIVDNQHLLSATVVRQATQNQAPLNMPETGLGWMINREWMGDFESMCFGHTAFTGPSIMIVPQYELVAVLLTNRTYPKRSSRDRHIYQKNIMNVLRDILSNR